jgi:tRNA dimethylallyltransferase
MSEMHRCTKPPADLEFVVAVIVPPRGELYGRIDRRVDQMAAQGLYDEFLLLLSKGFDERYPGMQCIGYRELFPVKRGECSLAAAIERIKLNTRHFAKRQCAWFKAHNGNETVLWSADRNALLRNVARAIAKSPLV